MNIKPQFIHYLLSSFYLWADHALLQDAGAFSLKDLKFSLAPDSRYKNKKVYSSQYHQLVTDSSISAVTVASSVKIGSQVVNRGDLGLRLDFLHGRAIFNNAVLGDDITGKFHVKDFNVYLTDEDEEVLLERAFESKIQVTTGKLPYAPPYSYIAPCIFILDQRMKNDPFAYGGEDMTTNFVKMIIVTDSDYATKAVSSFFVDKVRTCFPLISDFNDMPLDADGDIKGQDYSYSTLSAKYKNTRAFINKVYSSRVSKIQRDKVALQVAVVEFDIETIRYPRQS